MENSQKKYYGLIGYPVQHSFSALMHNSAFEYLGINAEYKLFKVKPEDLKDFLSLNGEISDINGEGINAKDLKGFNVTIPHKEAILKYVNITEKSVGTKEIGAVNTVVVNSDGSLNGFNTDYPGFKRDIKELKADLTKTAIIGAGGAAKAVAFALLKCDAKEIAIYDIDEEKGKQLVSKIKSWNKDFNAYTVGSIHDLNLAEKTLLINASPVGMKERDPLLVREDTLHKNLFVYDLIYNPEKTKLLELAWKRGLRFSNGLRMLLYQGMLSFELWNQMNAPQHIMFNEIQKDG